MPSTSDYNWWIKERKLGIGNYNVTSTDITATADFATVSYSGPAYARHFTEDLAEESDLPRQFHRAILAGFLRDYYEDKVIKIESDVVNQRIWSGVYNRFARQGRQYAARGKYAGILTVRPSEYGV